MYVCMQKVELYNIYIVCINCSVIIIIKNERKNSEKNKHKPRNGATN